MRVSRLFYRGVRVLCGRLGFGIFILAATRGGWLVGLVAASLVTGTW